MVKFYGCCGWWRSMTAPPAPLHIGGGSLESWLLGTYWCLVYVLVWKGSTLSLLYVLAAGGVIVVKGAKAPNFSPASKNLRLVYYSSTYTILTNTFSCQ